MRGGSGDATPLASSSSHILHNGRTTTATAATTKSALLRSTVLAFTLPALCDAGATTLLNLGLYYTYASVFQMLRGTLVVFAGAFTVVLLKRRLRSHNYLGIVLITAGAALVGASSIVYEKKDHARGGGSSASRHAPNPLLGDLLVILAQILNAAQFIIEEKFLRTYHPPVLLAVGIEGVVGVVLCTLALPLLSIVPGPGGAPLEDASAAIRAIASSPTLQWTTAATVLSIAAFNFCGISVTKRLSGGSRAAIDACRTAVVWLFCLSAGWERFHLIQLVGFAILISGTSVYNDILRSCMPLPTPVYHHRGNHHHHHHHHSRHRSAQSALGENGQEAPLLGDLESDSDGDEYVVYAANRREFSQSGGGTSRDAADSPSSTTAAGGGGGGGGDDALRSVVVVGADGSISLEGVLGGGGGGDEYAGSIGGGGGGGGGGGMMDTRGMMQQHRPPLPPPRQLMYVPHRGRTDKGKQILTMARSMTMMPSALSPHSLASVPSEMMLGLESVPSDPALDSLYAAAARGRGSGDDDDDDGGGGGGASSCSNSESDSESDTEDGEGLLAVETGKSSKGKSPAR